jgi:hypothetical protein
MGNSPVDRNKEIMREVWGTTSLTSDYWSLPHKTNDDPEERVIQEIMHDDIRTGQNYLEE